MKSSSSMSSLTSNASVLEPNPTPTDFLAASFSSSAFALPHLPFEASFRMRSSVRTLVERTCSGVAQCSSSLRCVGPNDPLNRPSSSGNTRSRMAVARFLSVVERSTSDMR